MSGALFWGLVAGSSLVLGGWLTLRVGISERVLGVVMAFGSGVLISAVAYELVGEAFYASDATWAVGGGLFAGAGVFFAGDWYLDRLGGHRRKSSGGHQAAGSPLGIVLGIVLDGVPESVVIGLSLIGGAGVSVAVITAVFLSNLPEAIAATSGLVKVGWERSRIMALWVGVMLVTGLASVAGYALFDQASPSELAFVLAFAGGAVLTMLADTMMPEAFEHGGRIVGLTTTLGFAVAFTLSALE